MKLPILATLALLFAAGNLAPVPVHAATKPSFTIQDGVAVEGQSFQPIATKSAKASSYSKITFSVTGGTCAPGVRYVKPAPLTVTVGNSALAAYGPTIQGIDDHLVNGDCTILVTITAVRNAVIARSTATMTIVDNDSAPPSPQWVSAPMTEGGYVRVKTAPDGWQFNGFPAPQVGSVWYLIPKAAAWIGDSGRVARSVQPIDQIGVAFTARYVWLDDLEGVAPAPTMALRAAVPDSSTAIATKTCMTRLGGASQAEARSGVVKGRRYRISRKWAGKPGMVGADSGSAADGLAVVPESCFSQ